MAKHSPAPWESHAVKSPARIVAANGDVIAMVYLTCYGSKKRTETHAANLAVIQAAPELAEALRELLAAWDYGMATGWHDAKPAEAARALISKLEGVA